MKETNEVKWDIPFDKEKPIPFVKHCRKPAVGKDNYDELYLLSSELTQEEKLSKYAKYYYMGLAFPDKKDLWATEYNNAMDPSKAFLIEDYASHMDIEGCCDVRTGYCILPNGVGFGTATTTVPGISAKVMSNYIENFNPPGDLYYKAWCPGAHIRTYETMVIEDVGFGMICIEFTEGLTAEKIGMPIPALHDKYCVGITGANAICRPLHQPTAEPLYVTELCYYRQMEDCYELRVTFWVGQHFKNGKTELHLPNEKSVELSYPSALARHNLWETKTFMRNILEYWKDCNQ